MTVQIKVNLHKVYKLRKLRDIYQVRMEFILEGRITSVDQKKGVTT